MSDYEFVRHIYDWGCDIDSYLKIGTITQKEYDEIVGVKNENKK